MLVESVVVDDAIVDIAAAKLRALALSRRPSNIVFDLPSLHLSHSSSSASLASIKSTTSSPPCSSSPPALKDSDCLPIVSSVILDLIEQVCLQDHNDIGSCCGQVNKCYDSPESFFLDNDSVSVRTMIAEMTAPTAPIHSPLLDDDLPFQASSLLDIFYRNEPKALEDRVMSEDVTKALEYLCEKQEQRCSSDEKEIISGSECEIIDINGGCASDGISDLDSSPDLSLDWVEFQNRCFAEYIFTSGLYSILIQFSSKSKPEPHDTEQTQKEDLIYFYEHKDFTPADLLPLYEPFIPLEFPYPKPESSIANVFCVENVSDLEDLRDQENPSQHDTLDSQLLYCKLSDHESIFADLSLGNEDVVLSLSDEEYRMEEYAVAMRSALTSSEDEQLSSQDLCSDPPSARSRLRRKRSILGDEDRFLRKRCRTAKAHCYPVPPRCLSDDDHLVFGKDQVLHHFCQLPTFDSSDDNNHQQLSSSNGFSRSCFTKGYFALITLWQYCIYFIGVMGSLPIMFQSICVRSFQFLKLNVVRLFDVLAACWYQGNNQGIFRCRLLKKMYVQEEP